MIEKNKTYTMEITGVGEKGEGIGRVDGFAVFVPYALVGEVVEVLVLKVLKSSYLLSATFLPLQTP